MHPVRNLYAGLTKAKQPHSVRPDRTGTEGGNASDKQKPSRGGCGRRKHSRRYTMKKGDAKKDANARAKTERHKAIPQVITKSGQLPRRHTQGNG